MAEADVLAWLAVCPNSTCYQIAVGLDAPPEFVSALLRKALYHGKVRRRGHTRATKWRLA
jgi:hypothetical protein